MGCNTLQNVLQQCCAHTIADIVCENIGLQMCLNMLFFQHYLFLRYRKNLTLAKKQEQQNEVIKKSFINTIKTKDATLFLIYFRI